MVDVSELPSTQNKFLIKKYNLSFVDAHIDFDGGGEQPRDICLCDDASRFFAVKHHNIFLECAILQSDTTTTGCPARCGHVIYSGCTHPALPGNYEKCGMAQKAASTRLCTVRVNSGCSMK